MNVGSLLTSAKRAAAGLTIFAAGAVGAHYTDQAMEVSGARNSQAIVEESGMPTLKYRALGDTITGDSFSRRPGAFAAGWQAAADKVEAAKAEAQLDAYKAQSGVFQEEMNREVQTMADVAKGLYASGRADYKNGVNPKPETIVKTIWGKFYELLGAAPAKVAETAKTAAKSVR